MQSQTFNMEVEWEVEKNTTAGVKLSVKGERGFVVGYDSRGQKLFVDRSKASDTNFHQFYSTL